MRAQTRQSITDPDGQQKNFLTQGLRWSEGYGKSEGQATLLPFFLCKIWRASRSLLMGIGVFWGQKGMGKTRRWLGGGAEETPYRVATCVTHIGDELREIRRVLGQADVLVGFLVVVAELFARALAVSFPCAVKQTVAVQLLDHWTAGRSTAVSFDEMRSPEWSRKVCSPP